jgi:transmembrane sensor
MPSFKDQKKYQELAAKWLNKTITPEEEQEFILWYNEAQDEPVEVPSDFVTDEKTHHDRLLLKIQNGIRDSELIHRKTYTIRRWSIAASIVFVLFISGLYLLQNKDAGKQTAKQTSRITKHNIIRPGGNKAVLTLADDSQIILDNVSNGVVATQAKAEVNKTRDGQLVYDLRGQPATNNTADERAYNTISTPRGGEYQVVLPDGTRVWLNAGSSLRFPVAFGKERNVKLTGEAYFEVAKDASRPFTVSVRDIGVSVLGTHFNIMAYSDEKAITTTLLEGKVKVTDSNGSHHELKPGEQAVADASGVKISDADIEQAVAWKNGYFKFERANIEVIMRQISRWYDVDISYEGQVSRDEFVGKIARNADVSQVLRVLQLSKVHFRIEGKRIIVLP